MTRTKLRDLRESLDPKVTQEDLSHLAGIRMNTYRSAETGKRISFTTARAIHGALNNILKERGLPEVDIFDLELNIV